MPKQVQFGDYGIIAFPDEMSDDEILSKLKEDKDSLVARFEKGRLSSAGSSFARSAVEGVGQSVSAVGRAQAGKIPANLRAFAMQEAMDGDDSVSSGLMELANAAETPKQRQAAVEANPLYQKGKGITEAAREIYQPNPLYKGEFLTDTLASAAGSTAPVLALAPVAGPVVAGLQYGLSQGEQGAEEAMEAGRPDAVDNAFLLNAGVGFLSELTLGVPANILKYVRAAKKAGVPPRVAGEEINRSIKQRIVDWKKANPVKGALVEGATREFFQEGIEQGGQNWIANTLAGYDPDRPLTQGVLEAATAGGLLGGVIGGGAARIGRIGQPPDEATPPPPGERGVVAPPAGRDLPDLRGKTGEDDLLTMEEVADLLPVTGQTLPDLRGQTVEPTAESPGGARTLVEAPGPTTSVEAPAAKPLYRGTTLAQWEAIQRGETPQSEFSAHGLTWATHDKDSATAYSRRGGEATAVLIEYKPSANDKVGTITDDPGDARRQGKLTLDDIAKVYDGNGNVIFDASTTPAAPAPGSTAAKIAPVAPLTAAALAATTPAAPAPATIPLLQQDDPDLVAKLAAAAEKPAPAPAIPAETKPAAPPAAPAVTPPAPTASAAYGSKNKLVSSARADELAAKLRAKFGQLGVGVDPEILAIGAELAAYHVEAGARKFADFSKAMLEHAGEAIRPYLRSLYAAARNWPDMDTTGMESDEAITAASTPEAPAERPDTEMASGSQTVADFVRERLTAGSGFKGQDLFDVADVAFGGTQAQGRYTPKDAYDAMELGMNQWIARQVPASANERPLATVQELGKAVELLPTQTKRTEEQNEFQQFSTPPPFGFIASWVANILPGEVVLEPSAGIGGIGVFAQLAGGRVVVNELSKRRGELLKLLGFARVFAENAEQLHNILPADVKPTVVVMNPPFSSTAGRMQGTRSTAVGAQHIEQALKRLQPGGRLVAIVGEGMAFGKPTFTEWWAGIRQKYNVRANIHVSGRAYAKYGTSFGNQIIVIDKTGTTTGQPLAGEVSSFAELIPLLEGIRNDRTRPTSEAQPASVEPAQRPAAAEDQPKPGAGQPPRAPTDAVGGGPGPGETGGQIPPGTRSDAGPAAAPNQPATGAQISGGKPGPTKPGGTGVQSGRVPTDKRPAGGSGIPVEPASRPDGDLGGERLSSTAATAVASQEAIDEKKVYEQYKPSIVVPGAKPHPTPLAESAAMSSVNPPAPTYKPALPKESITGGLISDAQLETTVLAGQSHQNILPDGTRQGFFIGDGTGVGKGREIAAILWDNTRQGRKKHLWISQKAELALDAKRDIEGIGWNPELLVELSKTKPAHPITSKQGVLFASYDTLKSAEKKEGGKGRTRLQQIVEWAGTDFDGVIAFDESHEMGNAIAQKGARGVKKASMKAAAGLELQKLLPLARVVYVSATGATEVINLAYANRLGIWGAGTPFAAVSDFVSEIASGGVAAMELVARDLKALGLYLARSLSFDGVTFGASVEDADGKPLEHVLTPEQTEIYNDLAGGWQMVLRDINAALQLTEADKNGHAKSAAMSAFWGGHQRFFNQIITSMQMPTVIAAVRKDLAAGRAVVMQLTNTNEASQERALAQKGVEGDENLDDLDLTPRDQLLQMIQRSFPVTQFEEYTDENGDTKTRPVMDSAGNFVQNPDAVAMRDALIERLGSIRVPDGPLEIVMNTFGTEMVAEVTGRKRRVVMGTDKDGVRRKVLEKRSKTISTADANSFMADVKQVLIFSQAGGTGRSYHADLNAKNQRKRVHYLIQAGWRADVAIQGLGRSHRSNQKQEPHYVLPTTNLPGQKRFVSSIARRLDQLGALTKGERKTGGQGFFTLRDNLESSYARDALEQFYTDLHRQEIEGLTVAEFQGQTGMNLLDSDGNLLAELPPITKFLNRLLSMKTDMQDQVFKEFSDRMDILIEAAIRNGTLDQGMETLVALNTKVVKEQTVHTEARTGSETKYVELELTQETRITPFEQVSRGKGFALNKKSGKLWAIIGERNQTQESGAVIAQFVLRSPTSFHYVNKSDLTAEKFDTVPNDEAEIQWDAAVAATPPTHTEAKHLITGVILPIWNRLRGHTRIVRVQTEDGRRLIGRLVNPRDLQTVLTNLGAEGSKVELTPEQALDRVLDDNWRLQLANGWAIRRSLVAGEDRVEITFGETVLSASQASGLKASGVFAEVISWKTRYFIPTDDTGPKVLQRVTQAAPVVAATPPAGGQQHSLGPSIGEATGMDPDEVQGVADRATRNLGGAVKVRVVDDPNWTENGHVVEGAFDPKTGQVTLNAAFLRNAAHARAVLMEELTVHLGLEQLLDEAGRDAVDRVGRGLTNAELGPIARQYGYDLTDPTQRRAAVIEYFGKVEQQESQAGSFVRFWTAVKDWLRRVFGVDVTNSEIRRVLRTARKAVGTGERIGAGERRFSLGPPAPPTIAPPTTAPEPQPSTPGVTMEGQRKLSKSLAWITDPAFVYRTETHEGREIAAKELLLDLNNDLELTLTWMQNPASEFSGLTDSLKITLAGLVGDQAAKLRFQTQNRVDFSRWKGVQDRAAVIAKTIGSAQGQGLEAMRQAKQVFGTSAFVEMYQDFLRKKADERLADKYPEVVSNQIKEWLLKSAQIAVDKLKVTMSKADAVVSRALKQARQDFGPTWREILTASAAAQGDIRKEIYRRILAHPMLRGLTTDDALELTNLLNKAWVKEWRNVFRSEFRKVVKLPTVEDSRKAEAATPELVKQINLGLFNHSAFRAAIAQHYGVRTFDEAAARRIWQAAQRAQTMPEGAQRDTAYRNLFNLVAHEAGLSGSELLKAYWYASILSSYGTQGRNVIGNTSLLVDNFLSFTVRQPDAFPNLLGAMLRGFRQNAQGEFGAILLRGAEASRLHSEIRNAGNPLETAAMSQKKWLRLLSNFKYVSRFMLAVDSFFYDANAEIMATFDAFREGKADGLNRAEIEAHIAERLHTTTAEIRRATDQARAEIAEGRTNPKDLQRRRNEILRQARPDEIRQDMSRFALEATLNNEPTGFMGFLYKGVIALRDKFPPFTALIPFARISANVTNMLLEHSPVGLVKMIATRPGARVGKFHQVFADEALTAEQWQQMRARVIISHALAIAFVAAALRYRDDKDPLFEISGTWDMLTPEQRKQLMDEGKRPYQVRLAGVGINYQQTPAALFFAVIGNYLDGVRYRKLGTKDAEVQLGTALSAGSAVIIDQQFLSGLSGFLDRPNFNADGAEVLRRTMRQLARPVTGLVPTITKEIDSMVRPEVKQAKDFWSYIQRDIPVARWSLKNQINVLGETIERPRTPVSWLVTTPNTDPVWAALADKADKGVFVPGVSASAKIIHDGKRVKMTEAEFYTYQKEAGTLYREQLTRDLEQFKTMTPKQAEAYFDGFDRLRELARDRVQRGLYKQ